MSSMRTRCRAGAVVRAGGRDAAGRGVPRLSGGRGPVGACPRASSARISTTFRATRIPTAARRRRRRMLAPGRCLLVGAPSRTAPGPADQQHRRQRDQQAAQPGHREVHPAARAATRLDPAVRRTPAIAPVTTPQLAGSVASSGTVPRPRFSANVETPGRSMSYSPLPLASMPCWTTCTSDEVVDQAVRHVGGGERPVVARSGPTRRPPASGAASSASLRGRVALGGQRQEDRPYSPEASSLVRTPSPSCRSRSWGT